MHALLKISKSIDWLNGLIGRYVIWLILASTVISGVNAAVRKPRCRSTSAIWQMSRERSI